MDNSRMLDVVKEINGVMKKHGIEERICTLDRLDRECLIYICSDCEHAGKNETLKSFGNPYNGFLFFYNAVNVQKQK